MSRNSSSEAQISTSDCSAQTDGTSKTRSPAIAEGPRDAGVPVEIW